MIKTFDEFKAYYLKYGKTPNMLSKPKNSFNDKQLQTKWKAYQKSFVKERTVDEQWIEVSKIVHQRDKEQCRFLSKLKIDNNEAYMYIVSTYPFTNILDLAHVIPRSKSKNLYYDPENIILLARPIHSLLDSYHDPITGKSITKEQAQLWWEYIIGKNEYEKLLDRK